MLILYGALSRLLVMGVAALAVALADHGSPGREAHYRQVVHPFTGLIDAVLSPLAKWDSVFYLSIAVEGYESSSGPVDQSSKVTFFPMYPFLIYISGGFWSRSGALISSYAISFIAFLLSVYLLHRLVTLEMGPALARPVILLLAFFPASLFFSAPYTESLFLLASLGSVYAARVGRWPLAGAAGLVAALTRVTGVAVIVPLLLLYVYGPRGDDEPVRPPSGLRPRFRVRRDAAWLVLPAAGLVGFALFLGATIDDPLAPFHTQSDGFGHALTFPLGALVLGVGAAAGDLRSLNSGGGVQALWVSSYNVTLLAFAALAVIAAFGTFRRLPLAYGAYVCVSLLLPLTFPAEQPLAGLPRYLSVLFPIFMWLGLACQSRRRLALALAVSVALLMVFTAQHSRWLFIA